MKCDICLSDMCNGGCCNVDYNYLQDIAYELKCKIAELGDSYAMRLKEGYACSPADLDYSIRKISRDSISKNGKLILEYKQIKNLLSAIEYQMKSMYRDYKSCVRSESICKIKDIALDILNIDCYNTCRLDLKVDSNNEQEWIDSNPYCVSREKWEELLYRVADDISMTLSITKQRSDIVYTMTREYKYSDITMDMKSTKKNCKLEFDVLKNTIDCKLSFNVYKRLRDCNISYDTIYKALDCGINFKIDNKTNCPVLFTLKGSHSLCDTENNTNEQLLNIIKLISVN